MHLLVKVLPSLHFQSPLLTFIALIAGIEYIQPVMISIVFYHYKQLVKLVEDLDELGA